MESRALSANLAHRASECFWEDENLNGEGCENIPSFASRISLKRVPGGYRLLHEKWEVRDRWQDAVGRGWFLAPSIRSRRRAYTWFPFFVGSAALPSDSPIPVAVFAMTGARRLVPREKAPATLCSAPFVVAILWMGGNKCSQSAALRVCAYANRSRNEHFPVKVRHTPRRGLRRPGYSYPGNLASSFVIVRQNYQQFTRTAVDKVHLFGS